MIKHVINDNGGTKAAADFSITVTGTHVLPSGTFVGNEAGVTVTLNAGAYSVAEASPSGYAPSSAIDCSGIIANGETKTCTITNDDIPPRLIVVTHVISDNGGTATAASFTMSVTGSSPSPAVFPGAEAPGTTVYLNAGAYSVEEIGPSGYAASSSADCSGSISVGETKTCTFTNDDIQPQLTVTKVVNNNFGGTATVASFTLSVDATTVASGVQAGFNAGIYTVSESGPAGYAATFSGDCDASTHQVALSVGDVKSCTITNNDIQPKLIVLTHIVNDNGGTATAGDFTIDVTGNGVSPSSFPGAESGTTVGLSAGSYGVGETAGPSGYALSYSVDCTGAINVGETKYCTVTVAWGRPGLGPPCSFCSCHHSHGRPPTRSLVDIHNRAELSTVAATSDLSG